jgi:hypothetical protein
MKSHVQNQRAVSPHLSLLLGYINLNKHGDALSSTILDLLSTRAVLDYSVHGPHVSTAIGCKH